MKRCRRNNSLISMSLLLVIVTGCHSNYTDNQKIELSLDQIAFNHYVRFTDYCKTSTITFSISFYNNSKDTVVLGRQKRTNPCSEIPNNDLCITIDSSRYYLEAFNLDNQITINPKDSIELQLFHRTKKIYGSLHDFLEGNRNVTNASMFILRAKNLVNNFEKKFELSTDKTRFIYTVDDKQITVNDSLAYQTRFPEIYNMMKEK